MLQRSLQVSVCRLTSTQHASAALLAAAAVFHRVELPLSAEVFSVATQAAVVAARHGEVARLRALLDGRMSTLEGEAPAEVEKAFSEVGHDSTRPCWCPGWTPALPMGTL